MIKEQSPPSLLLVEDDDGGRQVAAYNLKQAGYAVTAVDRGAAALDLLRSRNFDTVITDLRLPDVSGMEVLAAALRADADIPVIVITAYADVETAVAAMKAGAWEFLGKPFSRDHLLLTVAKAVEHRAMHREIDRLREQAACPPLLYASEAMAQVVQRADQAAASDAPILICGETGTGKEVLARRIHARSRRKKGPFVAVNTAALPDNLVESELFGHEKGAFTGAEKSRAGKFRTAHGGTLFLDEIGDMPQGAQATLLRVLQEGAVTAVGADTATPVDVRIVAATNADLESAIADGKFRADLYYRLDVVRLTIPPLRDRPEDIALLARHFIEKYAGDRHLDIPDDVMDTLRRHRWPGNVRELENACQKLALLSEGGVVDKSVLTFSAPSTPRNATVLRLPETGISLFDVERTVIEAALDRFAGNIAKAASYLRVPRHILTYRMKKYGLR